MYHPLRQLPKVIRDAGQISSLRPSPYLGIDLEWAIKTEIPTVLGLSDGTKTVSVPFVKGKDLFRRLLLRYPHAQIVGHNFLSSDLPVLAGMGIQINPEQVEDTILRYWLNNMHLCKSSKKDDTESERRGAGLMNLWTMLSLYTDLSNYKFCREAACEGPCPEHDVYGYNGLDALGPVLALPKLLKQATLLDVDKLYPLHRKLSLVLYEMRKTGLLIDTAYVEKLRENFVAAKGKLYDKETEEGILPFNPDSPPQVRAFFRGHNISLKNTKEETITKLAVKLGLEHAETGDPDLTEVGRALLALRDWKAQGDGADRWFAPRVWNASKNEWEGYVDPDGYMHPHLGFYASSARFQCSRPNMQNVLANRRDPITGQKMKVVIRKAVIAPPGYRMYKADYSNAENRVCLYLSGYEIPKGIDLHEWVKEIASITEDNPLSLSRGNAREAAKSIQHAGNNLEGISLLWPQDLQKAKIREEIRLGARIIFPHWNFQGKIVTFNGSNLAKRAFGSSSIPNRIKALEIGEKYFIRFPGVREHHMQVTKQIEDEGCVRPPNGYYLRSYGYAEDRMKTAAATWNQQPIAHYTKLAILNLWQIKERLRPILQVHDEILAIAPARFQPKYIAKLFREAMEIEVAEIPGLRIPVDVSAGEDGPHSNWGEMEKIK